MPVPGANPPASPEYGQGLHLLPVLDVQGGLVVHARAGQRALYAPLASPLVQGCDPVDVLRALLGRVAVSASLPASGPAASAQEAGNHSEPLPLVYVADLDAIQGRPPQLALVAGLQAATPHLGIWLDGGFTALAAARRVGGQLARRGVPGVRLVLGTETLGAAVDLSAETGCVLSLDFGAEGFRGDPRWLAWPEAWPATVIVMTLAAVGMAQGPDLARLQECLALAGGRAVYAAGGVRNRDDLAALATLGIRGALVASALHAGTLP